MELFVETGGEVATKAILYALDNQAKIEDQVLESVDEVDYMTVIDFSTRAMGELFSSQRIEEKNPEELKETKQKMVAKLGNALLQNAKNKVATKHQYEKVKKSIGAVKYLLPPAMAVAAAAGFPVTAAAAAGLGAVYEIQKIMKTIDSMKKSIDTLQESSYKTAMDLFKTILNKLVTDNYPSKQEVYRVIEKATEGWNTLPEKKIEEKLELIKVKLFCTVFNACFDDQRNEMIPFNKISNEVCDFLRLEMIDELKKLEILSSEKYLHYYAEKCYTEKEKRRYQKMVDQIDYIKKTSYGHLKLEDRVEEANGIATKVWTLQHFMLPEGEKDALLANDWHVHAAQNTDPTSFNAMVYKDHLNNWYLKIECSKKVEHIAVICVLQKETRASSYFFPRKDEEKLIWMVTESYIPRDEEMLSFLIQIEGKLEDGVHEYRHDHIRTSIPSFASEQFLLFKEGFRPSHSILNSSVHTVATVIGFMNITRFTFSVEPPTFSSGRRSSKAPWQPKIESYSLANFFTCKINYGTKGCVGIGLFTLEIENDSSLCFVVYWHNPYNQILAENSFGFGYFKQDPENPITSQDLWTTTSYLEQIPDHINFVKQNAKDGAISLEVDIPDKKLNISAIMGATYKTTLEIILSE